MNEARTRARGSLKIWRLVKGYALVLLLSAVWGLAFVAIRVAVLELSPVNLTLLRWFVASVVFLTLAPFIGRPKRGFQRSDSIGEFIASTENPYGLDEDRLQMEADAPLHFATRLRQRFRDDTTRNHEVSFLLQRILSRAY